MKWIVSRYNHKISYLKDYTDDLVLYDRSDNVKISDHLDLGKKTEVLVVKNLGSDISDKLHFIINNYDNLPEVAVYTKANLFDYIKPREFEKIKDNTTFTPILSLEHHTYNDGFGPVCYYKDGIYWERNNFWYLDAHPVKNNEVERILVLGTMLGIEKMEYVPMAPGSNYILPRETILKWPKRYYEKLRSYLDWSVYPGEAMIIERGLYTLWNIPEFPKKS